MAAWLCCVWAGTKITRWTQIASMGGIETLPHARIAHPKATQVQDNGCLALGSLTINKDNRVKISSLGGIKTVLLGDDRLTSMPPS